MRSSPTDDHPDELMEIMRWLRPAFREVYTAVEREAATLDISVPMRGLLDALSRHGSSTTPQLTRELAMPRQFVQRIVAEARDRGFVFDEPNPAHRTSHLHSLTPSGTRLVGRLHRQEREVLDSLDLAVSSRAASACAQVLRQLAIAFGHHNESMRGTP